MIREQVDSFRQALREGPRFGPFSKTEDPAMVECMGWSGFDFIILDQEHGPNSLRSLQHLIRAAEVTGMLPIVRVPEDAVNRIGAVLDIGAAGVQIPQVTTADAARELVASARYAPEGMRGVCRFVRQARYSRVRKERFFEDANAALVIVQLEGREALDNLDGILEVAGIDILFVGPYDLSQSLGVPGQTSHSSVVETVEDIAARCRDRGMTVGTFVESAEAARFWAARGVHYLCASVDVGIFQDACRTMVQELWHRSDTPHTFPMPVADQDQGGRATSVQSSI